MPCKDWRSLTTVSSGRLDLSAQRSYLLPMVSYHRRRGRNPPPLTQSVRWLSYGHGTTQNKRNPYEGIEQLQKYVAYNRRELQEVLISMAGDLAIEERHLTKRCTGRGLRTPILSRFSASRLQVLSVVWWRTPPAPVTQAVGQIIL